MRSVLLNAAPGVPLFGPSGGSAHLRGLAGALAPEAVVTARAVDRRGRHGAVNCRVVETGVPGWPSWLATWREFTEVLAARRCARATIALEPELVWERHSLFSDAGWKAHAATRCRWLLEVNAPLVEERLRYESVRRVAWARDWERDVLLAAPEIVAVSAWLAEWLRSLGCRRVRHVPNGVVPRAGDRDGTRARLGIGEAFVVGFIGSMKPWHGVERIVEVLDAIPEAVGLIVGSGPVAVTHPRCISVGQVEESEVADFAAAMDVGLAPYRADAPPWFCPLKVLAWRAQGTPVVASDVGDCRLLVGQGGTVTDDLVEAVRAWRGRRCPPWTRSWADVVAEGLG